MVEILTGFTGDAQLLLTGAIGVMAIFFVITTWLRTRSAVPTIGALIFGAVVIWGVANVDTIEAEVGEDIERHRDG